VLIHHPHAPQIHLPCRRDVLYMTHEEWVTLHRRLRSTAGVIAYVERALLAASGLLLATRRTGTRSLRSRPRETRQARATSH
jgi:hypothetical protein